MFGVIALVYGVTGDMYGLPGICYPITAPTPLAYLFQRALSHQTLQQAGHVRRMQQVNLTHPGIIHIAFNVGGHQRLNLFFIEFPPGVAEPLL